jgi:hypothetical protein
LANNKIQVKRTNVAGRTANVTNAGNGQYIDAGEFALNGTESRAVAVDVRIDQSKGEKGSNKIWFTLVDIDNPDIHVKEKAVFFVPR